MVEKKFAYWRKRVFITTWITYGTFYLGRVNISIAIPGMIRDLGYSKTQLGMVLSCLFFAYAAGQFINGQLADKWGARRFISIGLILSGILNILFGFSSVLSAMMLLWGLNGYFQAMGWAPSVKTIANWFPVKTRGKMSGLLGSSYQIGNACSWALAGIVVGLLGWRWAFYIPGCLLILSAIHWFVRGRNAPEEVGLPTIEEEDRKELKECELRKDHHVGFVHTLALVLKSKRIWSAAIALFFLNIVRYGFMGWAPTFMFEQQGVNISKVAFKVMALPLAGSMGALFAGYMSDRFFQHRRAPVATIMLILLGVFAWLYPQIPAGNWIMSLMCLMLVGFMTYGPHITICASMPMDFGTRKASASAAGFIDCVGYVGAGITGVGSGWLIDRFSWNAAFNFWVISAFIAAALVCLNWKYKPQKGAYH